MLPPQKDVSDLTHTNTVSLRIERANKTEARLFLYTIWLLMVTLLALSIVTLLRGRKYLDDSVVLDNRSFYYLAPFVASTVCLLLCAGVGVFFLARVVRTRRRGMYWSPRHTFLAANSAVLLVLMVRERIWKGRRR
jgi:hypothetical protein